MIKSSLVAYSWKFAIFYYRGEREREREREYKLGETWELRIFWDLNFFFFFFNKQEYLDLLKYLNILYVTFASEKKIN